MLTCYYLDNCKVSLTIYKDLREKILNKKEELFQHQGVPRLGLNIIS